MSASANQGCGDHQGQIQKKVETVEFISSAGECRGQIKAVDIVHEPGNVASNTSGGILANAAASVASTLESAKDAICRK